MTEIINLSKILSELAHDDETPLEELFNYYYPRLYNFSKSILKIEDGIDDILQEVFVKIWKNRKNIKSAATFNAYIFTITRNLLLNELRRRLNEKNIKEEVKKLSLAQEYSLSEQIEYLELKKIIDRFVDGLPERQKEIFFLSRHDGLSHSEISKKLGIKQKTVEYHISLAIKYLKNEITEIGLLALLCFYLFF